MEICNMTLSKDRPTHDLSLATLYEEIEHEAFSKNCSKNGLRSISEGDDLEKGYILKKPDILNVGYESIKLQHIQHLDLSLHHTLG